MCICNVVRAWSEDPAGVRIGVEGDVEGGEFGHSRERVSKSAIERTEDMNGGLDGDGECAHDAGDVRFLGECDDDGKIVAGRGEIEVAVEVALGDGIEERISARESGEVRRGEV